MSTLPQDPFMLLSVINTWLRDRYDNLDDLCAAESVDRHTLETVLHEAGFDYMPEANQFR